MKKIVYNATSSSENRIKVECSDGSSFFCEHLICTVPIGVLKKNHLRMFEPMLPRCKIESIEGMAFGTVNKIYVEFTKSFWDKNWEGVSFLWKQDQLRELRDDSMGWMKNIIGFYTVSFQPNILCGWISGDSARKMEQISDREFEASIKRVFDIFCIPWRDAGIKSIIRYAASSILFRNIIAQKNVPEIQYDC